MKNTKISRSAIPNLFTAMNMFCGFLSIINAGQGEFMMASYLIFIAAVFDALDGMVARLTKSSSALGVQLDSLSDAISFGAAPAYLIYKAYLCQPQFGTIGIVISSLLLIAGGFRLARFNVQLVGFDKDYFKGIPIPLSAISVASFILVYYKNGSFIEPYSSLFIPSWFVISLVIALSLLMVSTIKYDTLPKPNIKDIKKKPFYFWFFIVSIIALALTEGKAIFLLFIFIIAFGIIRYVYNLFTK
jgi:CDP-diacylglycerol---serine O-phosphatidyltransferase